MIIYDYMHKLYRQIHPEFPLSHVMKPWTSLSMVAIASAIHHYNDTPTNLLNASNPTNLSIRAYSGSSWYVPHDLISRIALTFA